MSGVVIAGALLRGSPALIVVVQPTLIKAWLLPPGSPTPSIVVKRVSGTRMQLLAKQTYRRVIERVQVTVRADNGDLRETILRLGSDACSDQGGTIAGFSDVSVLLAGDGPDFMDATETIFMGSFDLRVSFNEPA